MTSSRSVKLLNLNKKEWVKKTISNGIAECKQRPFQMVFLPLPLISW